MGRPGAGLLGVFFAAFGTPCRVILWYNDHMKKTVAAAVVLCAFGAVAIPLIPIPGARPKARPVPRIAVDRYDTWLRSWSDNVRTNTAIETCASFRETKLRPFLHRQMDPEGRATTEERAIMDDAVDFIWGNSGFRHFKEKTKLVDILERTADRPFADMVSALADNKAIPRPVADWLIAGKFSGEDLRCVFWVLRKNGGFNPVGEKILEEIENSEVDEWLKLVLRISVERRAAWRARGGGYANTVSEKGWKGFRDHGDACRAAFRRAMELHDYPEPLYLFASLGPFDDALFVKATESQLDYDGLYGSLLWYNCYPRWCGSLAKMKAFAERCYETKRHDTMIPYQYAEAMLRMVDDAGLRQGDYFRANPEELDRLLEVCLPQISSTNAFSEVRQISGVIATLAYSWRGDWASAGKTFASFWHGTLPKTTWRIVQDLSHWWTIWDGIGGPNCREMQRMQAMFAAGDYAGFVESAEALKAGGVKLSGKEKSYIEVMEANSRMHTDFPDGRPVVAVFSKPNNTWLTYDGYWRIGGKGAFQRGEYRSSGKLEWDVLVPGEFRVEMEIAPEGPTDDWRFDFCQMPSDPKVAYAWNHPYLVLRFAKTGSTAMFGEWDEIKDGGRGKSVPFEYQGGSLRLAIEYRDGRMTAYAGDSKTPFLTSDAKAEFLRRIHDGKLRINGARIRLLSMKVMRPSAE